jgi:hypothetical protein
LPHSLVELEGFLWVSSASAASARLTIESG